MDLHAWTLAAIGRRLMLAGCWQVSLCSFIGQDDACGGMELQAQGAGAALTLNPRRVKQEST